MEQTSDDKIGKRSGMKSAGGGEIIQVQGGHILRSTGRKDRHSKVCTAKGPRDRRVRLSAHTAIQFYDVQDRLGYDRPSKAVDWLMNKAKNAIDKLDELPPWNPNDAPITTNADPNVVSSGMALGQQSDSSDYAFQQQRPLGGNSSSGNSSSGPRYMHPSIDSQSIAETMRLFLPSSSGTSSINFQNYPPDIMSRASAQTGDLCLSLYSLQDPNSSHTQSTDQALFSHQAPLAFDSNYPRMVSWSGGDGSGDGDSRVGFIFNSQSVPQQPMLCQSPAFSQREPLQSTYSHLNRAWSNQNSQAINQSSISSSQFASEYHVPAQIHDQEQPGLASNNPSSESASSHHQMKRIHL